MGWGWWWWVGGVDVAKGKEDDRGGDVCTSTIIQEKRGREGVKAPFQDETG